MGRRSRRKGGYTKNAAQKARSSQVPVQDQPADAEKHTDQPSTSKNVEQLATRGGFTVDPKPGAQLLMECPIGPSIEVETVELFESFEESSNPVTTPLVKLEAVEFIKWTKEGPYSDIAPSIELDVVKPVDNLQKTSYAESVLSVKLEVVKSMDNSQERVHSESALLNLDSLKLVDNLQEQPEHKPVASKPLEARKPVGHLHESPNTESAPTVKLFVVKPIGSLQEGPSSECDPTLRLESGQSIDTRTCLERPAPEMLISTEPDAVKTVDDPYPKPGYPYPQSVLSKREALKHECNLQQCQDIEPTSPTKLEATNAVANLQDDPEAAPLFADGHATKNVSLGQSEQMDDDELESFALRDYALKKDKVYQNVVLAEDHSSANKHKHNSSDLLMYKDVGDSFEKLKHDRHDCNTNEDFGMSHRADITTSTGNSLSTKHLTEKGDSQNTFNCSAMFRESQNSNRLSLETTEKCYLWRYRDRDLQNYASVASLRALNAVSTPKDDVSLSTRYLLDSSDPNISVLGPNEINSSSFDVHDKSSHVMPNAETTLNHNESLSTSLCDKFGAINLHEESVPTRTRTISRSVCELSKPMKNVNGENDSFYEQRQEHSKTGIRVLLE